jgi:hypothetical protein
MDLIDKYLGEGRYPVGNSPSLDSLKYDPSKYAKNTPLGLAATLSKKAKERHDSGSKDRIGSFLIQDIESSFGIHIKKKDKAMTKKLIDKLGKDKIAKKIHGGMDTMNTITDWIES